MTEEVGRRLIDGVWVTNVERQDGSGGSLPAGFAVDDNATLEQTPTDQAGDSPFINLVYDPAQLVDESNEGLVMDVRRTGTDPGDSDNLFRLGVNIFAYVAAADEGAAHFTVSGADASNGVARLDTGTSGLASLGLQDGAAGEKSVRIGTRDGFDKTEVIFPDLPTSDPLVLGQLWSDTGTLKVSAGPPP